MAGRLVEVKQEPIPNTPSILLGEIPRVAVTDLKGRWLTRGGPPWPLSGSVLLPLMEQIGRRKTPDEIYPLVGQFYNYIRVTDDFFDNNPHFPTWLECQFATSAAKQPVLEAIENSSINPIDKKYILGRITRLGNLAYLALASKENWPEKPSFEQAYKYRWDTTGALSEVVADTWCIFAGVKRDLRPNVKTAVQRIGMVFQYRDDLMDLREDTDRDGNLIRAILNEEGEKDRLLSFVLISRGRTKLMALMKHHSPRSKLRTINYLVEETGEIKDINPKASALVTALLRFSLARITVGTLKKHS